MNSTRIEDLNAIRWHLSAGFSDLNTILKEEAAASDGKVPRELNVTAIHLGQAISALNQFLRSPVITPDPAPVTPEQATAFLEELNSGTDS